MLERAGEALPGRVRERLSSNLFPPAFSVLGIDYLLGIRIFATVCAPLAVVSATRFSIPGLALAVPCAVAGYALPMLMIRAEEARHSEAVRKALPDMADLMYVLVLGGRNLDQAFRTAARVSSEPLRSMLAGPVKEMDLGSTREQCFNALLERHPVPELSSLLRSLLEAERLGFPPAGTLEVFAREIRLRRRDQVRVAAAKAPLKMLAPLVFLVLPSSLMLTVGPAFLVALSRGF